MPQWEFGKDDRSLVGSLNYSVHTVRPDIAEAVRILAHAQSNPTARSWMQGQHVLGYLKRTRDYGINYCADKGSEMIGYSDASYALVGEKSRSITGYVFKIAGGPISWKSYRQNAMASSTMAAEYMALSDATREAVWLRNLYGDVSGYMLFSPTTIYEDNEACIAVTSNRLISEKSKHIQVRFHVVRDHLEKGEIRLKPVPTDKQEADIFTKILSPPQFSHATEMLGIRP